MLSRPYSLQCFKHIKQYQQSDCLIKNKLIQFLKITEPNLT